MYSHSRRPGRCGVVGLAEVFWNGSVWGETMINIITIGEGILETDKDVLVVILPNSKIKTSLLKILKRSKLMKENANYFIKEKQ